MSEPHEALLLKLIRVCCSNSAVLVNSYQVRQTDNHLIQQAETHIRLICDLNLCGLAVRFAPFLGRLHESILSTT